MVKKLTCQSTSWPWQMQSSGPNMLNYACTWLVWSIDFKPRDRQQVINMKPLQVDINKNFIGRKREIQYLLELGASERASILVIYGRRRVGKTELIEQSYHDRNLIKLEGLQGKSQVLQIENVMYQLSRYLEDPHIAKIHFKNWVEVFDFIADKIELDNWILYFEELQWLANYEDNFVSELKYVWDNRLRHNKNFIMVLCGSAPSFMVNNVLHSKALYNRSTNELHLKELSLKETQLFMPKRSLREIITAYLILGGIPEYLLQIDSGSSVLLSIAEKMFKSDAYFFNEYDRIFISSMAENPHYKLIVEFLSKRRFATRKELTQYLKIQSGGSLTEVLDDLLLCGFIEKYTPYHVNDSSMLTRYCINDAYLAFYFKFIKPIQSKIIKGDYIHDPVSAIQKQTYQIWMGYAFERLIRQYSKLIAKILGFSGIDYKSGVFFNRRAEAKQQGYQIDLIFERGDHVYTVCEIKYYASQVDATIIDEIEKKLSLFPNPKHYTIQRILITTEGASRALLERHYFDRIITLTDLFDARYW